MEEIWKGIPGYEEKYQASNLGRIRSTISWNGRYYYKKERILVPQKNCWGRLQIDLSKNGKVKKYSVHRLVAQTFIPNPENKPEINHIDGNKLNNNIENLEWVTSKENVLHAYRTGLRKSSQKNVEHARRMGQSMKKAILQYDLNNNFLKEWNSITEASKALKINHGSICSCCKGRYKQIKGYIFKYKLD